MARRVFYRFHYKPDVMRASQVRQIGALEGNKPASDNDWEKVKGGGGATVKKWIAGQMKGRLCTVVLVGRQRLTEKANNKYKIRLKRSLKWQVCLSATRA